MPEFSYVVVTPDGHKIKAVAESLSEQALRHELMTRELEVRSVRQKRRFSEIEVLPQRIPMSEIMHFSRQIAAFVRSGISLLDALEVIEEGTENKRFRLILADMRENVESGMPFSEVVALHESIFPPYYMGILRSAELTGRLDEALDQLSTYIERDLDTRSTVVSALSYPAVLMGMSVVTVLILSTFVLPKFTDFFESMDAKLPPQTRLLIFIGDFFKTYWFVTPLFLVSLVVLFIAGRRTERGRVIRDTLLLRLPAVGIVVQYAVVERFARVVAAMIQAGVPLVDAMRAASAATNNRVYQTALVRVQERMLEGDGLAEPLADTEVFPRAATQMMRVGENTGTLDIQLNNVSAYYSRELEYRLKKLTALFEPAVIIFMGVIVGFVAIALVSAIYGVIGSQKLK